LVFDRLLGQLLLC